MLAAGPPVCGLGLEGRASCASSEPGAVEPRPGKFQKACYSRPSSPGKSRIEVSAKKRG